jgi:uncharacterized cupin superfamily protein
LNVYEDNWAEGSWPDHPAYAKQLRRVGEEAGAKGLGGTLYELQPGAKSFPYHWHYGVEEMLVVLEGELTVRTPDGEQTAGRGDVLACPTGPAGAHQLRNETSQPVRYLMLSNKVEFEVAEYPDSDKIGILSEHRRLVVRPGSAVDYLDGEG